MSALRTIRSTTFRRLAVSRQHLADSAPVSIHDIVRDIGCLQLDPISAVAKSHTLVLWSRLGAYDLADLDSLLYKERALAEYWAHEASIIAIDDYQLHHARMRNYPTHSQWRIQVDTWLADDAIAALHHNLLERLRADGPLPSRVFEQRSDHHVGSSGWTSGTSVNKLIDYLWQRGEIMVASRQGNQRLWDIAERCLPEWTPREELSPYEVTYRAAQKAIRALGIARPQHIMLHFIRRRYHDLSSILKQLEADNRIQQVAIVADDGKTWGGDWYIHSEDLPLLEKLEKGDWTPRTTLLSPFDNLICDRKRTLQLFDFAFTIEIYVPQPKRQYGYYVLPILQGDRIIGRVDPLMDKKQGRLVINNVYAEPNAPDDAHTIEGICGSITSLGQFLGAKQIDLVGKVPAAWEALRHKFG